MDIDILLGTLLFICLVHIVGGILCFMINLIRKKPVRRPLIFLGIVMGVIFSLFVAAFIFDPTMDINFILGVMFITLLILVVIDIIYLVANAIRSEPLRRPLIFLWLILLAFFLILAVSMSVDSLSGLN